MENLDLKFGRKTRRLTAIVTLILMLQIFCSIAYSTDHLPDQPKAIIYVDALLATAADENPGTKDRPVRRIARALSLARKNLIQQIATTIIVGDGVYRESIGARDFPRAANTTLVIEASSKGKAVISGSDSWGEEWDLLEPGIYYHRWHESWGLASYPPGWEGQNLAPIIRRREMVFADDKPLNQVLSMVELRAKTGSFYVAESEHRIYLHVLKTARFPLRLDVTTRTKLLEANGFNHLVLRGLVFEHAGSPIEDGAVVLDGCEDILIEGCEFRWNNWIGLVIRSSRNVRASGNVANHNGGAGMTLWRIKGVNFQNNETSYNNWRGAQGGFTGWAVAGIKSLRIHDGVFKDHRSTDNSARGFWLDYDCKNVSVVESFFCRNQSDGVFVEGSEGPITIAHSVVCNNRDGLVIANSEQISLQENVFYKNAGAQLLIGGEPGGRSVTDWETRESYKLDTQKLVLSSNVFVADAGQKLLLTRLTLKQSELLLRSLNSNDNAWSAQQNAKPFQVGGRYLNFAGWKDATGQDSKSTDSEPSFEDPAHDKFGIRPGSRLSLHPDR